MPSCFVKDCPNSERNNYNKRFTFHSFPNSMKQQWLAAINRDPQTIINQQRICSEHFKPEDFEQVGRLRKVKADAIPSINLLPRTEQSMLDSSPKAVEEPKFESSLLQKSLLELITENSARTPKRKLETNSSSSSPEMRAKSSPATSSSASSSTKRKIVSVFHNYSLSPEHYKKDIQLKKQRGDRFKTKFERALRTSGRRKKKIISLKAVVNDLKKKFALSTDALSALENSFAGIPLALMRRMILNSKIKGNVTRAQYPKELRTFAMTLQFYSSKAYDYVRKTFDLGLPAPSTIRAWLSKIDCSPGFSKPSLESLKIRASQYFEKHNRQLLCALILDEMAIKKEIISEKCSQTIWGYIDVGSDFLLSNDLEPATEALVIMVVAVNDNFKLPIAYFFINKISGEEKANIVREALCQLHGTGVKILSVTCDGPQVHFRMMKELGCSVTDPDNFVTYFPHPIDNTKLYVIFDICHMLKLIRNNWANTTVFVDPDGREIRWEFIIKLHEVQQQEGLYLGNKLRKKHIEWKKAIMKVNLAAQTLSSSVADALTFLCEDLHLEGFEDVAATVKFIKIIDQLFDILNSRNPWGRSMKTPLRTSNEDYWRPNLEEAIKYILSCTDKNGTPLYKTMKKVPFLGFAVSAQSFLQMYDEEVKLHNTLNYILTYKFSQDHLELFFCSVRSRNGWNVNPNCLQFMRTYKRLLLHQDIRDNSGNCIAQDQTNILTVSSTKQKLQITDIHRIRNCEDCDQQAEQIERKIQLFLPVQLNEYFENVISYISGFVIRMLERRIKCCICLEALHFSEDTHHEDTSLKLINRKSRGGLLLPALSLREVCKKVEKKIQILLKIEKQLPTKTTLINSLLKEADIMVLNDNLFPSLSNHCFDLELQETSHKKILIFEIIKCYSSIRIHSITQRINEDISGEKIRTALNKLILFKHQ